MFYVFCKMALDYVKRLLADVERLQTRDLKLISSKRKLCLPRLLLMKLAIETKGLTKRYGSLTAVNKLNLKVKRNTIHGFLGPNGAGKTTTIKILVGLLRPDKGSVRVLGQELHGEDSGFFHAFYENADSRLGIGYMPELPKFPKHLKGTDLLEGANPETYRDGGA
jgi:ABC-type glutathione transport system ATPase component